MDKIRVLLVDDHVLFVESLRTVIDRRTRDIAVLGIALNGKDAIRMTAELAPDIILMDIRMPDMSGVECTRIIKERHPGVQIMMLTTFDDDEYILQALGHGAVGYLLKDADPSFLISAIRSVHRGGVLIAPQVAKKLLGKIVPHGPGEEARPAADGGAEGAGGRRTALDSLSRREHEVLNQLAKGLTNREIADALFIAEQTVKNHVSEIYAKLGVHDRAQALRLALEAGIE
jgi:DNA-binding NarL/FixJ family response regulator